MATVTNRRIPREYVPHRLSDRERVAEYRRNGKNTYVGDERVRDNGGCWKQRSRRKRAFSSGESDLERRQAEEREARLSKRRTIDRARRQALSTKQTEERLQLLYNNQQRRLAAETPVQREECLQQLSHNQQRRLAGETPVQREERLQQLSHNQQRRIVAVQREERIQQDLLSHREQRASESVQHREARLQQDRQRQREQRSIDHQIPLFYQPAVHGISSYLMSQILLQCHAHMLTNAIYLHRMLSRYFASELHPL